MRLAKVCAITFAELLLVTSVLHAQTPKAPNDPVGKLNQKLENGSARLEFREDKWGYLSSVLKQLNLNVDSQILVFSKTSFQQSLISPKTPRALYFNDDIVLGAVQNAAVFELTSLNPNEGLMFYSLIQSKMERPHFKREFDACTFCHSPINRWAPGIMVATVFPDADGKPFYTPNDQLFKLTDHRSPFEERWGGYYVTGTHGKIKHRGNAVARDPNHPQDLDTSNSSNVTSLADRFDTSKYLAPTSDLVALMTLEHQTMLINIMTSVGAQFRFSATFPLPADQLSSEVDRLVSYMLFVGETPLESPVKGVSTFSETFPQRGPRDSKGRSLRDFDLQTRLFKYPLSYMIYSASFDGLPATAREQIYRRLYDVLSGKITSGTYASLDAGHRRQILEILIETKKGLPKYFKL